MKGGAVIDERSPLKDARDLEESVSRFYAGWLALDPKPARDEAADVDTLRKDDQLPLACAGTASPSDMTLVWKVALLPGTTAQTNRNNGAFTD